MNSTVGGGHVLQIELFVTLALSVVTAWLACGVLGGLNFELLTGLHSIVDSETTMSRPVFSTGHMALTTLLCEWPLVFALYLAAKKTNTGITAIVTLQALVLAYFCQTLAWSYLNTETLPLAFLLGLTAALILGKMARQSDARQLVAASNKIVLSVKEEELKEAHLQLVKQDEADRRILASDLHDQVLNDLKSIRTAVGALKDKDDSSEITKSTEIKKIEEIEAMIDQTTGQVREVMENLTPSVLENLGLASALDDLLRRSAVRGKFKTRFKNEGQAAIDKLSSIEGLLIFRTVQEALSNIVKHAGASKVELEISNTDTPSVLTILVNDDGLGFPEGKNRGQSRGLRYMRQRIDLIGGHIAWLPGKDSKGCRVQITIEPKESL